MSKRKIPFVMIKWLDAADSRKRGWQAKEDLEQFISSPIVCYSAGWLVAKTRWDYILSADWSPAIEDETQDDWSRPTKIPKKMVVEVKEMPNPFAVEPEEEVNATRKQNRASAKAEPVEGIPRAAEEPAPAK